METVVFTELINTVGFPIAVTVALFWQNYKNHVMYNETFTEFKEVIKHNSDSLAKLTELVNDIKKGGV